MHIKATLQAQQQLRALSASLYTTWLCPAQSALAKAALAAGVAYDRETKSRGPGHALGSPHVHIWMAVADCLAMNATLGAEQRQFWQHLVAGFNTLGMEATGQMVKHFRVKTTYNGSKNKNKSSGSGSNASSTQQKSDDASESRVLITLYVDPLIRLQVNGIPLKDTELASAIKYAVHLAVAASGGSMQSGQAPKGQLERLLEAQLRR